jgi:thioredoxin-related protein
MMKYIIMVLLLAVTLFGDELGWSDDYNKALQQAKKEHKLLYVLITSVDCGWCKKFERTTLQDEGVKKRLKKEFVSVHFIRELNFVPEQFKTTPIPRHYFTDPQGNILYNSLGYRKVDAFEAFMDNAEEKYEMDQEEKK